MSWQKFGPQLATLYAAAFTRAQLQDLTRFYQTPTGQKAVKLLPEFAQKSALIGETRARQHILQLQEMLKARTAQLTRTPTEQERRQHRGRCDDSWRRIAGAARRARNAPALLGEGYAFGCSGKVQTIPLGLPLRPVTSWPAPCCSPSPCFCSPALPQAFSAACSASAADYWWWRH